MRETRKSNQSSQQPALNERQVDVLRQAIEHEYPQLFRRTQRAARKTARHLLRHVVPFSPPRLLDIFLPASIMDLPQGTDDLGDTVSVTISDGANQKTQKYSTGVTVMPALTSIRELISYVPAMKNIGTRGHLTGIPYLGDKFDDDDQQIINSISGDSLKHNDKPARKNRLDDSSLEVLYQTMRTTETWSAYSNEKIIDAIIHYHRDSSARARLTAWANRNDSSSPGDHRPLANIDACDNVDVDIDDLVVKSWCSRFCPRCYTYNCLLHKEKPSHLPLPKQISITADRSSSPCSSTCYKHEREHLKRSLSPSYAHDFQADHLSSALSSPCERRENIYKRRRPSSSLHTSPSSDKLLPSYNENVLVDPPHQLVDGQKKLTPNLLTRIENYMKNQFSAIVGSPSEPVPSTLLANHWTFTDRSLFRLFYFLVDGDLCLITQLFDDNRTCQDVYKQFILDTKYFFDRLSATRGLPFCIRQPYRRRMLEGATRAFLLHVKKHLNGQNDKSRANTVKPAYQPCVHDGPCSLANADCHCMRTGTYCEKFCQCPIDCPHRFPGCLCKGACLLNNCLCCAEGRECDPDLCHKCGASSFPNAMEETSPMVKSEPTVSTEIVERKALPPLSGATTQTRGRKNVSTRQHSLRSCRVAEPLYKMIRSRAKRTNSQRTLTAHGSSVAPTVTCANISLQRNLYKQILIAESDVAGYGAFLGSPIAHPGDLIAEYTGEIISEDEADRRGRLYDKQACSYLFNLDADRCVDARQFGNKIRFANHSSKPNCVPKVKLVNGDYRIGIYAKQTIFQGDELFFEYMYNAHQRQQFVNNERIDQVEQDGLSILKRYGDHFMLVRPTYD